MPSNILIVGAGAVGAFYGSRLAIAPDTNVSVVCRSNYAAVASTGFNITSPKYGSYRFIPANVFASPSDAIKASVKWDYILVCTKALPDVSDDSTTLIGLVTEGHTAIVLVQNGLGIEAPYSNRFPNSAILSAVTVVSAAQNKPGEITHNRWTRISIGPFLPGNTGTTAVGKKTTELNGAFVKLLKNGGVTDAESVYLINSAPFSLLTFLIVFVVLLLYFHFYSLFLLLAGVTRIDCLSCSARIQSFAFQFARD